MDRFKVFGDKIRANFWVNLAWGIRKCSIGDLQFPYAALNISP
jgi:hypothetical protein